MVRWMLEVSELWSFPATTFDPTGRQELSSLTLLSTSSSLWSTATTSIVEILWKTSWRFCDWILNQFLKLEYDKLCFIFFYRVLCFAYDEMSEPNGNKHLRSHSLIQWFSKRVPRFTRLPWASERNATNRTILRKTIKPGRGAAKYQQN